MRFTRGERFALVCYALVVLGFMPPVIVWANNTSCSVFGVPFLLFWITVMVLMTSVLMTLAFFIKERIDKQ